MKTDTNIKYFIAYTAENSDGMSITGHCDVTRNRLVRDHSDIESMAGGISQEYDIKDVIITNWRRYEGQ